MASPIITGLMTVFSITTVAVIAFPLYRLAPSWLEGRKSRKVAFHRDAAASLALAMTRTHNDQEMFKRLYTQHEYHLASLKALAPGEAVPAAPAIQPAALDAAA